MDLELRVHLKDQPEIRAFHYKPIPFLQADIAIAVASSTAGTSPRTSTHLIYATDPILTVKDRLVSVIADEVGIPVRSIDVPLLMLEDFTRNRCHHNTLDELRQRLQKGLIMDFTSDWGLEAYLGFHIPARWYINYSARVRLIRLEEAQVLWQGVCAYGGDDPLSNRPTLFAFEKNQNALLKAKLNEATDTCVQELTRQIKGN
jgi:hypothetical protein